MRNIITIAIVFIALFQGYGQTRSELEQSRKETLEEITYVDNLIKQTEKQKATGLSDIRLIGSRITLRENIISGYREEIELLNDRIEINKLAIDLMEADLVKLRNEYARTILNSYKTSKGQPEIAFILSASDFNQGYKRLRYLQQVASYRRNKAEVIAGLKEQIESTRKKLIEDLRLITDLKNREEQEKGTLQKERDRKRRIVDNLSTRERQLRRELEDKRKAAIKIENEISRIIEEERKLASGSDLTPEMKLIGNDFLQNEGRLPWPVERGVITEKFGIQDHPVLKNVKEENLSIEITSTGVTYARSVFKGQVVKIFAIQGANMSVIIKHGRYYTVYQNLVSVKVAKDQMVDTKQEIGIVYQDASAGGSAVMKFAIFDEREKVDPEVWIVKK